jgi:hypothetical protein
LPDAVVAVHPDQQQIAEQLLAQAKEQGVSLVGPGGLLGGLTKTVLEVLYFLENKSPEFLHLIRRLLNNHLLLIFLIFFLLFRRR